MHTPSPPLEARWPWLVLILASTLIALALLWLNLINPGTLVAAVVIEALGLGFAGLLGRRRPNPPSTTSDLPSARETD